MDYKDAVMDYKDALFDPGLVGPICRDSEQNDVHAHGQGALNPGARGGRLRLARIAQSVPLVLVIALIIIVLAIWLSSWGHFDPASAAFTNY
jgi:hypothetical protein